MNSIRKHSRLLVVAISCLALGAGASAIANAGASSSSNAHAHAPWSRFGPRAGLRGHGMRLAGRRAVHGDLIVWTKNGFVTMTFDRGTVESVSGQQLTIAEGTATATYKQVTLTIPTTAQVRDNRQPATLSKLQHGQRVIVVQSPSHTFVIAHTPLQG